MNFYFIPLRERKNIKKPCRSNKKETRDGKEKTQTQATHHKRVSEKKKKNVSSLYLPPGLSQEKFMRKSF